MQLKEAIKTRKSVRRFSSRKPDWRKILKAIDMARLAPMAGNQFSLKFVLVQDEERIKKVADSCQQNFVKAPYLVVVVSDVGKVKRSYGDKGEKFACQQAGAAIENFLLALTDEKLATCWVGYFAEDQVKRALEIPGDMNVEAVFPVGRATKATGHQGMKSKPELDNIVYFDKWNNKYMEPLTKVRGGNA